ncbi:SRPBCC family protein [Luedemannella flava]|uniref:SRPBCC family protein n=1 Tax=Luedemannella flava TaxID=349316 RepID=A0ABN2LMV3_9ACTN
MIEIMDELGWVQRTVAAGGGSVGVLLKRRYDADAEDVWDALTDPERVRRWFLPLTVDARVGGAFQLEGNAGGEILACDPPKLLRVTFGGETSIVELRLTPDGDATTLELEHTVPVELAGSGAGALFVGPGWDGALLGLGLYLAGEAPEDPAAAASSPEVQEFSKRSAHLWAAAALASGTATQEQVDQALAMSLGHFSPDV